MHYYSYIAGGGIGNRSSAISSFVYDLSINATAKLVWEYNKNNIGSMAKSSPETIWSNWNLSYTFEPITSIFTIPWYIPARASKSSYVRNWWKQLNPVKFIKNELNSAPLFFDGALTIRNPSDLDVNIDVKRIILKLKEDNIKTLFIASDRYSYINSLFEDMSMAGFKCFTFHNSVRLNKSDKEAGSIEHNLWSVIDWYTLQKSLKIYKNIPFSTFTDFSEFMLDIPVEILPGTYFN